MYAVSMMKNYREPVTLTADPWTGEPIVGWSDEDLAAGRHIKAIVKFPSEIAFGEPCYETIIENREWAKGNL